MNLFKEEEFGKTLNENYINYLKANTSRTDVSTASEKSGIGTSTIRDVAYGYNPLTKSNSKGIEQLLVIAKKNLESKIDQSKEVTKFLEENLVEHE